MRWNIKDMDIFLLFLEKPEFVKKLLPFFVPTLLLSLIGGLSKQFF